MNEWYIINNLEEFINKTRAIVYNNFGNWSLDTSNDTRDTDASMLDTIVSDQDKAEFDRILSYKESLVIVKDLIKKQKHKLTKKVRYVLNDDIFVDIIKNLNERIVSNIINSLAQKGLVESAFDSELNDFVFWIKDEHKEKDDKPETD